MDSVTIIAETMDRSSGGLLYEDANLIHTLARKFRTLPAVLSQHGAHMDKLKMIGQADKGTAYSDGDLVVKVTEDAKEARASAHVAAGNGVDGVNQILYVGEFAEPIEYQEPTDDEPIETQYYLIIQDKLNTRLSPMEKDMAHVMGDFLATNYRRLKWPLDHDRIKSILYWIQLQKTGRNYVSPKMDRMLDQLLDAVEQLREHGVEFFDVGGNVGKDELGNYVLFDLGVGKSGPIRMDEIS